jgi:hypothetical protein
MSRLIAHEKKPILKLHLICYENLFIKFYLCYCFFCCTVFCYTKQLFSYQKESIPEEIWSILIIQQLECSYFFLFFRFVLQQYCLNVCFVLNIVEKFVFLITMRDTSHDALHALQYNSLVKYIAWETFDHHSMYCWKALQLSVILVCYEIKNKSISSTNRQFKA